MDALSYEVATHFATRAQKFFMESCDRYHRLGESLWELATCSQGAPLILSVSLRGPQLHLKRDHLGSFCKFGLAAGAAFSRRPAPSDGPADLGAARRPIVETAGGLAGARGRFRSDEAAGAFRISRAVYYSLPRPRRDPESPSQGGEERAEIWAPEGARQRGQARRAAPNAARDRRTDSGRETPQQPGESCRTEQSPPAPSGSRARALGCALHGAQELSEPWPAHRVGAAFITALPPSFWPQLSQAVHTRARAHAHTHTHTHTPLPGPQLHFPV
ncbi:uncharacterized protein LOC130876341 [Chionomys nivalis]|uniref:uncharacterized protein LOC130876341 n=1 Tax=Chionomys nivalis TaxID=269649 RepID=UPI0025978CCF|nr:uncharacterized protein LOC130876341 [Chionomys nivalis]